MLRNGRTVQVGLLDERVTDRSRRTVQLDLAGDAVRHEAEKLLIAELCASDAKVPEQGTVIRAGMRG